MIFLDSKVWKPMIDSQQFREDRSCHNDSHDGQGISLRIRRNSNTLGCVIAIQAHIFGSEITGVESAFSFPQGQTEI